MEARIRGIDIKYVSQKRPYPVRVYGVYSRRKDEAKRAQNGHQNVHGNYPQKTVQSVNDNDTHQYKGQTLQHMKGKEKRTKMPFEQIVQIEMEQITPEQQFHTAPQSLTNAFISDKGYTVVLQQQVGKNHSRDGEKQGCSVTTNRFPEIVNRHIHFREVRIERKADKVPFEHQ